MLLKGYKTSRPYPTHSLAVENQNEFPKFIREEEIKQSEYYADKIPEMLEDLKIALEETINIIANWGYNSIEEIIVRIFGYDFDINLRNDLSKFKEQLLKAIAPQMKLLKEKAPVCCNEILKFIDETLNTEISDKIFSIKVWQGTGTNEFVKIVTSKNTPVDSFKNTAIVRKGDFELAIENFSQIMGVKTSTHKLLDILMLRYSETKEKEIEISIQEFMKLRGLKDRKTSEEQVKEDLTTLYNASISFKQKEGNKTVSYNDARIIQDKGQGLKNGIIRATFGDKFFNAMQSYHIMPMPPAFLALNDRHNPNAYHLGRRITLHKNMNYGKPNEDLMCVETLLDSCPNLRTHEEVYKSGESHYNRKIIEPFERDMNALEETGIFTWEYCHSNAVPLTDEEIENLNYKTFKNLLIKITWHIYPFREIEARKDKPKARKTKGKSKNTKDT